MRLDTFLTLALVFIPYSLTSIGGGGATLAGIQNDTVNVHHWLTSSEFIDVFAISRAAPGPGMMIATVVGWRVAGWLGAAVATLAFFMPSSLLCYAVFKMTNNYRDTKWHKAMREGLAPVGIGLIIAGVIAIFRVSGGGIVGACIAVASGSILFWMPWFPTLVVLFLGAATAALLAGLPALLGLG